MYEIGALFTGARKGLPDSISLYSDIHSMDASADHPRLCTKAFPSSPTVRRRQRTEYILPSIVRPSGMVNQCTSHNSQKRLGRICVHVDNYSCLCMELVRCRRMRM